MYYRKCIFYCCLNSSVLTFFNLYNISRRDWGRGDVRRHGPHIFDMFISSGFFFCKEIFPPPMQHQNMQLTLPVIAVIPQGISHAPCGRKHIYRAWRLRRRKWYTMLLPHYIISVSLSLVPWPGNSSITKTVLFPPDNRYTLIPAGNGNSESCIYFH